MMTLTEIKTQTDKVFGNENLTLPEPNHHWQRKLEALEEANLEQQHRSCLFDMRCEQAATLGFEAIESEEMVEMLMGESPTTIKEEVGERQQHEYFYNHITGVTLEGSECNWGGKPSQFYREEKKFQWWIPPFGKFEKWRCQFGKLDYLKRKIPYGVVLRINEVKSLNLFNVFNVMAPMEAWERKTDTDPVVVATIWSIEDKGDKASKAGQVQHFFLAQW